MAFKKFQEGVSYRGLGDNAILVELLPQAKIHLLGKCEILVLKGSVDILGFELKSHHPQVRVYSPKGHSSLLTIQSITTETLRSDQELKEFLDYQQKGYKAIGFTNPRSFGGVEAPDVELKEGAVFALMGFDTAWCNGFRTYGVDGTQLLGPRHEGIGLEMHAVPRMNTMIVKLGFRFLETDQAEFKRILKVPPEWNAILNSILAGTKSYISIASFGGKGVGKSTFNRWLCNKLSSKFGITTTLFIDLDPGQSELTPPGVISVSEMDSPFFGPNFTNLLTPLKAVYLGTVSVTDDPEAYRNGMKILAQFINANEAFRNRHMIINTMGFCSGLGVELAVESIKLFRPKSVIQIGINNSRRCFPFLLTPHNVSSFKANVSAIPQTKAQALFEIPMEQSQPTSLNYEFHELESVCSDEKSEKSTNQWGMTPKDLRENMMVAYFAGEVGDNLLGVRPKVLSTTNVAFGCKSSNFSLHQMLDIVNGNLVALCEYPPELLDVIAVKSKQDFRLIQFDAGVAELPIVFHGYGIVRGLDAEDKKLYIITPVAEDVLVNFVNCVFLAGTIGVPSLFLYHAAQDPSGRPTLCGSIPANRLHGISKRQFVPNRGAH